MKYKRYFYLLGTLFVGCLFFYITYKTPLAGDDWGYALNGMSQNPFAQAIAFYQSWSGRFFSELWGFLVAPNRWIWNIVNPLLFVIIFLSIYRITHVKKYFVIVPLWILAVILSVDDNLRMETYTWLMGTTYIIPLALGFLYFVIIDHLVYKALSVKRWNLVLALLSNVLLFYIGLTMENIAGAMILAIVLLLIYSYFHKREMTKFLWINLIVLVISFSIMRLSPGSSARLLRDNAEWAKLGLFEKIANGYPSFIEFTFLNNNYLILFFSLSMILLCMYTKEKIHPWIRYISMILQMLAVAIVFSFVLPIEGDMLSSPDSIFNMIFWPIYIMDALYLMFTLMHGKKKEKAIFFFLVGGSANLAMMYSPVFGSRSSIYTVVFLIVTMTIVLESIDMKKGMLCLVFVLCLGVTVDRFMEYRFKYNLVGLKEAERQGILEYYRNHPEVEEAWIPRFPIYTIHGADIEPGDTYHFETFKDYYKLPQAADKITFYVEEVEE